MKNTTGDSIQLEVSKNIIKDIWKNVGAQSLVSIDFHCMELPFLFLISAKNVMWTKNAMKAKTLFKMSSIMFHRRNKSCGFRTKRFIHFSFFRSTVHLTKMSYCLVWKIVSAAQSFATDLTIVQFDNEKKSLKGKTVYYLEGNVISL